VPITIKGVTETRTGRVSAALGVVAASLRGTFNAPASEVGQVLVSLGRLSASLRGQFALPVGRTGLIAGKSFGPAVASLRGIGNLESLLSMANRSLTEGNSGTTNMTFALVRGADPYGLITFSYQTIDGTATAGSDYTAVSGTSTIASGQTVNINVPIIGDTNVEADETFTLRVYNVHF